MFSIAPSSCYLLNILAGFTFLGGSSLFLPQFANYAVTGVYLFMLGSVLWIYTSTVDFLKHKKSA
ncbi:YrhK family protein [Alteromonas sp. RKMC-009]|uniref:YrhK family protein n=1 Tax=Alteromonas sp. RKMC-009 TaxID=2267264 RepID=UPI000E6837F3|nr:YrhK family protein [Alteromonas sp. RKMC-009]AYA63045.1 hypothetical protein DS731_02970 [Alteromonas sp. RKMC-009]